MPFTIPSAPAERHESLLIPVGEVTLHGDLDLPHAPAGLVIFAHGSGSSRHSPRNQLVARLIRQAGLATLLFDLLTSEEEAQDEVTRELRFDIPMLADRLVEATRWIMCQPETRDLPVGFFGASTGGAAALVAAAALGSKVGAVVSRGGRPDLAGRALQQVTSPTLLIVGGSDHAVLALNEQALTQLRCKKDLRVVGGASHLFQEPGKLEHVARLSAEWFQQHLTPPGKPHS